MPLHVGQETVIFPGFDGGAEWGGSAFDPATDVLYVNANEMAWTGGLTGWIDTAMKGITADLGGQQNVPQYAPQLTVDFTPAPEPSSLMIFLAAPLLLRRRRARVIP